MGYIYLYLIVSHFCQLLLRSQARLSSADKMCNLKRVNHLFKNSTIIYLMTFKH